MVMEMWLRIRYQKLYIHAHRDANNIIERDREREKQQEKSLIKMA